MSTTLKADLLKLQDQIAFLLAKLSTVQGERELSTIFWELGIGDDFFVTSINGQSTIFLSGSYQRF